MKSVLYARFSPGNNQSGDSAEAQLEQCRKYAELHELEVVGEFKDEWVSGKNDDRPGFQAAIKMTCKQKATMIVYSLSRFARSTKDAIAYAEQLSKAKANLASIKENLDTNTSMGRFFFTVMAAIAQLERETISERTRDAMVYYQSQGRIMGSRVPYGFKRDPENPKMMIPSKREIRLIALIQQYRAEDLSHRSIAQRLWLDGDLGRRTLVFRKVPADRGSGNKTKETKEVIATRTGMFNHKTIEAILKRAAG